MVRHKKDKSETDDKFVMSPQVSDEGQINETANAINQIESMRKAETEGSRLPEGIGNDIIDAAPAPAVTSPAVPAPATPVPVSTAGGTGSQSKFESIYGKDARYILSQDRFEEHILPRHGYVPKGMISSRFNFRFDIRRGIDEALTGTRVRVRPNTDGRKGYIFEKFYPFSIGVDSDEETELYTLRIVVDENGEVITAFPV